MSQEYGEAFETYYRLELNHREGPSLHTVIKEPLEPFAERAYEKDLEERQPKIGKIATKLSEELNFLANKRWESSANVYLRAIDKACAGASVTTFVHIVRETQVFFSETFGEEIVERGESKDLLDQIVKRTGPDSRERFQRLLGMGTPEEQAEYYLDVSLRPEFEERIKALEELGLMSRQRLREVRAFASALSAKRIVTALTEQESDGRAGAKDGGKKGLRSLRDYLTKVTSGPIDNSLANQKSRVLYGLVGRTTDAFSVIQSYFDAANAAETSEDEATVSAFKQMLEGLDEVSERQENATSIAAVLADHRGAVRAAIESLFTEKTWTKSHLRFDHLDARDTTRELLGEELFEAAPKRAVLRKDFQTYQAELEALPLLKNMLRPLRGEALDSFFEEGSVSEIGRLHAEWYPELRLSLFQRAHELAIAIEDNRSPSDLFFLIAYLDPWEIRDIRGHYQFLTGFSLESALHEYFDDREKKESLDFERLNRPFFMSLLKARLRYPAVVDVLSLFVGELRQRKERESSLLSAQSAALAVRGSMNEESLEEEFRVKQILSIIGARPNAVRELIEFAYYRQSPHQRYLFPDLSRMIGDASVEVELLLEGYDIREVLKQTKDGALNIRQAFNFPNRAKKLLVQEYEAANEKRLSSEIHSVQSAKVNPEDQQIFMCLAFFQEASEVQSYLVRARPLEEKDEDQLLLIFDRVPAEIQLLERSYDVHFGSLRGDAKLAMKDRRLGKTAFGELLFRLEGIEPDLLFQIDEALEGSDLPQLHGILSSHVYDIRTINEVHRLVYDVSLRERIDVLKASRDEINRCCLLTMGYSAESMADSLRDVLLADQRESLVAEVLKLLERSPDNPGVPDDPNWTDEMIDQVRKMYREKYGPHFVSELRMKGFEKQEVDSMCYALYGKTSSKKAAEVYKLLRQEGIVAEKLLEALEHLLQPLEPGFRRRVIDLYDDYFGSIDQTYFSDFLQQFGTSEVAKSVRYLVYERAPGDNLEDDPSNPGAS